MCKYLRNMTVVVGRSKVITKHGIVAASQPLASQAGAQVLERGGNAVDAAIAANAVLGVVEPQSNGIGGDLFAIVSEPNGSLHGLNAGGWAPSGLTPALLKSQGFEKMPSSGIHSVTVPGAVAGWESVRNRLGSMPMRDLLAAAIFYARDGFPVSEVIADAWAGLIDKLAGNPEAAGTYLPAGRAPRAGEVFKNAHLADSLQRIAAGGSKGFYEGATAEAVLALSRDLGGTMTAADLRLYEPEWVNLVSTTYRGWNVYELPPNTQGIAALMMLNLMEQFPLREYGFHTSRSLHVMIEAKKLAYADMIACVGDPAFADIPVPAMLDKAHAHARAQRIDSSRAAERVEPSVFAGLTNSAAGDTVYLCAIDKDGMIVSLIQSIFQGFGSGLVPRGTGFALHNRGGLFTMDHGHPNVVAPRKRPLHTIIPGFMQKDGVRIGFGIMGAFNQAQAHAQFVANVADYDMDIQQALEAGRFTKATFTGADVSVEALVPPAVREELAALGHDVTVVPPRTSTFGHGQVVMCDDVAKVHYGASEPRHDGAAIPEAPPASFTSA